MRSAQVNIFPIVKQLQVDYIESKRQHNILIVFLTIQVNLLGFYQSTKLLQQYHRLANTASNIDVKHRVETARVTTTSKEQTLKTP